MSSPAYMRPLHCKRCGHMYEIEIGHDPEKCAFITDRAYLRPVYLHIFNDGHDCMNHESCASDDMALQQRISIIYRHGSTVPIWCGFSHHWRTQQCARQLGL